MGNLKNFQLIMVVLFTFGGILGVFVFAGFIDLGSKGVNTGPRGTVTIWGTYPKSIIDPLINENNQTADFTMRYVAKDPNTFESELLEAFAIDKGPDLFFLPDNLLIKYQDKISVVPYTTYPLINFKNTFVEAGESFLNSRGIIALPVNIDPLMMYYNKTLLDSNNIIYPPSYWEEFPDLVKIFTKKNSEGQILKSAFALGQAGNVNNAKEILLARFMQYGNNITYLNKSNYRSSIKQDLEVSPDLINALEFYMSFSDPLNANYSWNRSLPNSQDAFSQEDLVFYFGFASELGKLFQKNPNHNFGVYPIPQNKGKEQKATLGRLNGIAISLFTKDFATSYAAMNTIADSKFAEKLSKSLAIPPARRDLLAKRDNNEYGPVFYSSALFAKPFIDPSKKDTDILFRGVIESILSNGSSPKNAIDNFHNRLNLLLLNQ